MGVDSNPEPDVVLAESREGVTVLTLNRPAKRNAVSPAMSAALEREMLHFEADGEARVAVLTGAGGKAFSAGADLAAIAAGQGAELVTEGGGFAGFVRLPRRKPVIAAVEGDALAGGMEIVLAADVAIASEASRFGLPEVRHGLAATGGGVFRLVRGMPRARAIELLLTGDRFDAQEAHRWGLVSRLTPAGATLDAALELAGRIAAISPNAVRESLAIARRAEDLDEATLWDLCDAATERILADPEAIAGSERFLAGGDRGA